MNKLLVKISIKKKLMLEKNNKHVLEIFILMFLKFENFKSTLKILKMYIYLKFYNIFIFETSYR